MGSGGKPKPKKSRFYSAIHMIPEMAVIPAGSFLMGGAEHRDQQPVHRVHVKSFSMGKYPVTFAEYDLFATATRRIKPNGSRWGYGNLPVVNVTWNDAQDYAEWLSQQTGRYFRLPSEAEWEYAARAGVDDDYYWGNDDAEDYAWFKDNSDGRAHPVGEKKPNAYGLYDMSGNVWEWIEDSWHDNYLEAPTDGSAWLEFGLGRPVLRGGSWGSHKEYLGSAYRNRTYPDFKCSAHVGFRLVSSGR